MKFAATTVFASLAGVALSTPLVLRQAGCSEAERFGTVDITPSTLNPGDAFTITGTFRCSAEKGINPQFIDYTIEVLNGNNGHEAPIFLGRHDFPTTTDGSVPVDTLQGTLPTFSGYFAGAPYQIVMTVTYPVDNGDGTVTMLEGGVLTPITINGGN